MADKEFLSEELNDIEDALCSLVPNSSGIDRDRLLFLAGQASGSQLPNTVPRRIRIWQITSALSTTAAVVLGVMLANRGQPEVIYDVQHEIRYVQRTPEPSPMSDSADQSFAESESFSISDQSPTWNISFDEQRTPQTHYLRMRDVALRRGVDAMAYLDPRRSRPSQDQRTQNAPVTYWSQMQLLLESNQHNMTDDNKTNEHPAPGEFDGGLPNPDKPEPNSL